METAQEVLAGVRSASGCVFWPDAISYRDVDGSTIQGHRQVTDTYLATLARHHGGRLATLDTALAERRPDDCLLLPTLRSQMSGAVRRKGSAAQGNVVRRI